MDAVGECPNCGKPVVEKSGQYGKFLSCSGYPGCKTICVMDSNGNLVEKVKGQGGQKQASGNSGGGSGASVGKCPKCGADVIEKHGKFGAFLSCSAYPQCSTICVWDNGNLVEKAKGQKSNTNSGGGSNKNTGASAGKCPKCGADVFERNGKWGPFLSCSGYPNCRTICVKNSDGSLSEKMKNQPQGGDDAPF
jgi:DNA topoisomerase-1